MCANISGSFFCMLIFYFQTPSFCRQSRENTALCHTYITLPGMSWTLIIPNKLFLHADSLRRFPSQSSSPQKLSCQVCLVQKQDLHHSFPSVWKHKRNRCLNHSTREKNWLLGFNLADVAKQYLTQAVWQLTTILAKRSCSYYIRTRFFRRKRGNSLVFILKQISYFSVCWFRGFL